MPDYSAMYARIIPVMDLQGGLVVRGVGGRRHEYRPVAGVLADSPQPGAIARAYAQELGFERTYVADLDAIAGGEPDWDAYRQIVAAGLAPWIDAGLATVAAAESLIGFFDKQNCPGAVVAGLETMPDAQRLAWVLAAVGADRLVFSLDLKNAAPLAGAGPWRGKTPEEIAMDAFEIGVRRMIVLDLARVGEGGGVGTEALCSRLRAAGPRDLQLIGGGGVRCLDDVQGLIMAGCNAVLVASALHDGRIRRESIAGG